MRAGCCRRLIQGASISLVLALPFSTAWANGFQGIPWSSKPGIVLKKYPNAYQVTESDQPLMTCKNENGSNYPCSVSEFLCLDQGLACHPAMQLDNYMVGNIVFDVVFHFSKKNQLDGVSLNYLKPLLGEKTYGAKSVYDGLLYNLQRKYGNPFYQEQYREAMGMQCIIQGMCLAHGVSEWRKDGTRIVLQVVGKFDPDSHRFVDVGGKPKISISYEPIVNDVASKL